ncbi:serine hydrolase domain-containing protein [Streptomyces sp. NPDC048254]|uniref:serine hydrolase domain-containing protein n=1 Tax=Streptomyces sp. NPDC048254 TaxID=3365525 RepID=UPI0037158E81
MSIQSQTTYSEGFVAPGFEPLREAFERNFVQYGEVGASCAVYVDGEPKVDLWGGPADVVTGRPWQQDTVGLAYSVTKGATAILCCLLADRGELDLDAPVARYWPSFAGNGKAGVSVRMILAHQAGLPVLDGRFTRAEILEDGVAARALAGQEPLWTPGTAFGYHALTYGWLLDEVVRRATGRTIRDLFAREVVGPLGLDFFIGLPDGVEHRVAALVDDPMSPRPADSPDSSLAERIPDPELRRAIGGGRREAAGLSSLLTRAMTVNGALRTPDADEWNTPSIRRASLPAANGITNARSVARLYASCVGEVDGLRLLSGDMVTAATGEQSAGRDRVTELDARFGSGFMLPTAGVPMLSESSFGHEGVGGALGFADRDARVGFGYVQNLLKTGITGGPDLRVAGLLSALRDSLGR